MEQAGERGKEKRKRMAEQLCSNPLRNHFVEGKFLGPSLKIDPKTTEIGDWNHLMVKINLPFQTHCFPVKVKQGRLCCTGCRHSAVTGKYTTTLQETCLNLYQGVRLLFWRDIHVEK